MAAILLFLPIEQLKSLGTLRPPLLIRQILNFPPFNNYFIFTFNYLLQNYFSMKKIISIFLLLSIVFMSCKGSGDKKTTDGQNSKMDDKKESNQSNLVDKVKSPDGVSFERQNFEGIGTIELPAGSDWVKDGNTIRNEKWDCTIVTQSHSGDMLGIEKDYLDSYNDVNKRDAPKWNRGKEELGTIEGISVARVEGNFNNGTAYATRDYIFFTKNKVAMIQCRIAETNKNNLADLIDYIAASYKK